jgi:N-acetylneuraminic acid mutarotase
MGGNFTPERRRIQGRFGICCLALLAVCGSVGSSAASAGPTAADQFFAAGSMNVGRYGAVSANVAGGVVVAGGISSSGNLSSAERYDSASDTWRVAGAMSAPRYEAVAATLGDGRVLVAGGQAPGYGIEATADIYDPTQNGWTRAPDMSEGRDGASAVTLLDGSVLVIGGSTDVSGGASNTAERYDPTTDQWSAAGSFHTARIDGTATLLGDGRVLYVAGASPVSGSVTDVDIYDPASNSWSSTAPIPGARHAMSASRLADGTVLVAGGYEGGALRSTEIYHPDTGSWTSGGQMNERRSQHVQETLPDGSVLVMGGIADAACPPCNQVFDSADRYVPGSGWSTIPLLHPRYFQTANVLDDGSVLMEGGTDDHTQLATAERYVPATPDTTAPIVRGSADRAPNAAGWYNAPVTVTWTAEDADDQTVPQPAPTFANNEGANVTYTSGATCDSAGNCGSGAITLSIDRTAPTVTVTGVADHGTYTLAAVPNPGCATTDQPSGVASAASLAITGGSSLGVGDFTATCANAQDFASNIAGPVTVSYSVRYGFTGFFGPVDNAPIVNTGKGGKTYPVRWSLTDANMAPVSNLSAVTDVTYKPTNCASFSTDPTDALETSTSGATTLVYDASAQQYTYNWRTPKAPGCYTLFVGLADGSSRQAFFKLT